MRSLSLAEWEIRELLSVLSFADAQGVITDQQMVLKEMLEEFIDSIERS